MAITAKTLEAAIELFINEKEDHLVKEKPDSYQFEIIHARKYIPNYLIKRKQDKEGEWLVYATTVPGKGDLKCYASHASFCIRDIGSLLNFIQLYRLQIQLRPNVK